jgi:hypothetical protein
MSISFRMELVEKVVFPEENLEPDVYYQPIAIFELGNFRALRELLTVDEINKYCGEKEMSGEEVEHLLHSVMEKCDYRTELAWEYLSRVLLNTVNGEYEIRELIAKITWC